jgi:hypothetical protein
MGMIEKIIYLNKHEKNGAKKWGLAPFYGRDNRARMR